MLLNKTGESIAYEDKTFTVGEKMFANSQSFYEGLNGTILEIRAFEDKVTENEDPEIAVKFDEPYNNAMRTEIEARFTMLHGVPKTIDDIALDYVVMAPEMLYHGHAAPLNVQ
jgi:hypothetical protein